MRRHLGTAVCDRFLHPIGNLVKTKLHVLSDVVQSAVDLSNQSSHVLGQFFWPVFLRPNVEDYMLVTGLPCVVDDRGGTWLDLEELGITLEWYVDDDRRFSR